jgi:hypothetical protein
VAVFTAQVTRGTPVEIPVTLVANTHYLLSLSPPGMAAFWWGCGPLVVMEMVVVVVVVVEHVLMAESV